MANLFIQIDRPFYIAGDTVNGCVFLNLFQNINARQIMVKFKGWQSVRWFEERIVSEQEKAHISPHLIFQSMLRLKMDSSDSEDHPGEDESAKFKYIRDGPYLKEVIRYSGQRYIARFDQVLHNFGGNFIPAGQYSFPFSFKTGQNYPASFADKSQQNNRRGRIKYEMQAYARGFDARLLLLRTKQEIVMREMAPIKNDQQQMEAHVKSCCCIDKGVTRIQCFFQKNGYTPGEDARIYCKLDNTQGKAKVLSVDVTLLNEITYTSGEGFKKTFSAKIFTKNFSGLEPGQQGERQNVVKIINATGVSSPADIKPTARGNKLHSVYFLVVQANLDASCTCCSDLPVVRQPVLIYPFIPVDYTFNAPPNWNPQVMPPINLMVALSSLGVQPAVDMAMGMNMGPPAIHVIPPNVHANPPAIHVSPPKVHMRQPEVNLNFHMGGPSAAMKPPTIGVGNPTVNVQIKTPAVDLSSPSFDVKMKVPPPPAVELSFKNPPALHLNGNAGFKVGATGVGLGVSAGINSPTRINGTGLNAGLKTGGVGVGLNLRPF